VAPLIQSAETTDVTRPAGCFASGRMRRVRALGCVALSSLLMACGGEEAAPKDDPKILLKGGLPPSTDPGSSGTGKAPPASTSPNTPPPPPPAVDANTLTHPEVVYVLMDGKDGLTWFCTGTLVSPTVVVTAAHCLQSSKFNSWEVLAPTVTGRPRAAAQPTMYDEDWAEVENADLGILKIATAITLPEYAVLAEVTADVESGKTVMTRTIVRTGELPEAPFKKTGEMKLSSTVRYGYDHGFGVPLYSHGGDSGAGMFLVENGQMTHKLVAVEREPDPARKLDHLTRVDAAFIAWLAAQ
jgi:hypothetical protein